MIESQTACWFLYFVLLIVVIKYKGAAFQLNYQDDCILICCVSFISGFNYSLPFKIFLTIIIRRLNSHIF